MSTGSSPSTSVVSPQQAWESLAEGEDAALIDVRTQAEWAFVGVPDLSEAGRSVLFVEWARYPDMSPNPDFVREVLGQVGTPVPAKLYFLCRSGVRSLHAARAVAQEVSKRGLTSMCINVAEGFEGDLDAHKHRGQSNGWKSRGLAWRQS